MGLWNRDMGIFGFPQAKAWSSWMLSTTVPITIPYNNGFPLEELNHGGLYLTSDGEIFVGGINGLISFWEKDLLKKATDYSILFTSLFVNNREVRPGDETGLLDKDLPFTESITLDPQQNIITVHYSSNNYVPSIRDSVRIPVGKL